MPTEAPERRRLAALIRLLMRPEQWTLRFGLAGLVSSLVLTLLSLLVDVIIQRR